MQHIQVPILAIVIFLQFGCASSQSNHPNVEQTLQTYVAGKTTLEEFKSDSTLKIIIEDVPTMRYLEPSLHKSVSRRETDPVSPWKVYETRSQTNISNGNNTEIHEYVVGSKAEPLAILSFDGKGVLQSIKTLE